MLERYSAVRSSPRRKLPNRLAAADFDPWIERRCQPYYEQEEKRGQPSIPPGVYFRILLVGYFEGIDSQRGIAWRCADSLSLRQFLGVPLDEGTPDPKTLSNTRRRLPEAVFDEVFQFVLSIAAEKKLLSGRSVGVDSTLLEANAAMKSIVRRDTGENWKQFVTRLMHEEGAIEGDYKPTDDEIRRFDKQRKNKKVSNDEWVSPSDQPLPILTRIVEAPVFAFDGALQTDPGYHANSQTIFAPCDGFTVLGVPWQPTTADVDSARELIRDELLGDFPFIGDAERAHAIAMLLLPFARDLITGPTPLHLIEKPSPGTGATLLVDMLSWPSIGRPIPAMTEGRDEDEWRKRITAKLRGGAPFTLIDNLRRRLDSAAVSAAITSTTWEDRLLGFSEMVRLPVRCCWVATGNNPAVSTEIARRTVRIRMDAKIDRPWLRDGRKFRHENLRKWVSENRSQLVRAALVIIRAWLAEDRPVGERTLGMFESWSEVMGGILSVAEVPGFLSNLDEFYEASDAEGNAWRAFLVAWWDKYGEGHVSVKEHLIQLVREGAELSLGDKGEQSQRIILGKMLSQHRDRVFDLDTGNGQSIRVRLERDGQNKRATVWLLHKCE